MKLTSKEARNILEIERKIAKNDRWIDHCNCVAGGVKNPDEDPFITEFLKKHKYSIEERIINLCDLMCPPGGKVYTIDKRLIDLILRRGAYSNTQYHIKETYKLKEYFDNLLGYNLYDLFPEIKNNL